MASPLFVSLLLFLLGTHAVSALPSPNNILNEIGIGFFRGIMKGILGEAEPEYVDSFITPMCIFGGEDVIEIFESAATNLTQIEGLTDTQLQTTLQNLVLVLEKSFIPQLPSCGVNASIINNLTVALNSLNQAPSINYTAVTLVIAGIEVYEELATFLGEWDLSNFNQAGYYFGVMARKVSTNTTAGPMCYHVDDSSLRFAAAYGRLTADLQKFATSDPTEKFVVGLNWVETWDWCRPYFNSTENICQNGLLGYNQYDTLATQMLWQSGRTFDAYFDQNYMFFLSTGPVMNTTEDYLIKQLTIESREYEHRIQQAQNMTESEYQAYAQSTQNPVDYPTWAAKICTNSWCQAYTQDNIKVNQLYQELLSIYNTTNAFIINYAVNAFQNSSNYCNYTSEMGGKSVQMPCYETSIMPNEWMQNYQNGQYQGEIFVDIENSLEYEALCAGGMSEYDPSLIAHLQDQGFLQLEYDGEWHQVDISKYDFNINITYEAKSVTRVNVTTSDWFTEGILWRFRNAPSQFGGFSGDYYFNPQNGSMNAIISGMLVASEVHYQFNGSTTFGLGSQDPFSTNFNITGAKVGPFFLEGFSWEVDTTTVSFSSYLNNKPQYGPYILGYIMKQLPYYEPVFPPTSSAPVSVPVAANIISQKKTGMVIV